MTAPAHQPAVPTWARRWTLAAMALVAACVAAAALLSASWPAGALRAVLLLPVLLLLRGIALGRQRAYAWATLCVAPYLLYGLTEVIANPALRATSGAILFAGLAWFVTLVIGLRAAQRAPAAAQPAAGD